MSPGEVSELAQSNAVAFRVTFQDTVLPPEQRYWRGLVLSAFDGRSWRQSHRQLEFDEENWDGEPPAFWRDQIERLRQPVGYQVMLETTHKRWLYTLTATAQWTGRAG